ncbi:MCRI2 protein, partial [Urocolius indicus]|nr:MCRI2 protein [Urocolius indicus]
TMYTLTRGPSKLTTQRRTGPFAFAPNHGGKSLPPHLLLSLSPPPVSLPSPAQKLVFNRVNGRRALAPSLGAAEERYTSAHEENVRFIYEAWQQVEQQLDGSRSEDSTCGPVQYVEKTPSPVLNNFVPIDLEEWWAQQFLKNCS